MLRLSLAVLLTAALVGCKRNEVSITDREQAGAEIAAYTETRPAYACKTDCDQYRAGVAWAEANPLAEPHTCPQTNAAHRLGCLETLWLSADDVIDGYLESGGSQPSEAEIERDYDPRER